MLKENIAKKDQWIIGGSIVNWESKWLSSFDLVVFLYIPREIRMQRLKDREIKRYGNCIFTDTYRIEKFTNFLNWAYGYDDNSTLGRNLHAHKTWLKQLSCPIIRIDGDMAIQERIDTITDYLKFNMINCYHLTLPYL